MAIISINEGQSNTVSPANTLLYPGINSCLSITTVLSQATRLGGHAVLFPEAPQQDLQQICNYINTRKNADMLYIIGDVGTWNQNWAGIPQCQNLIINGQQVQNVLGIATALGYANKNVIFDIASWDVATYNIYFGFKNKQRKLWAIRTDNGVQYTVPGHDTW